MRDQPKILRIKLLNDRLFYKLECVGILSSNGFTTAHEQAPKHPAQKPLPSDIAFNMLQYGMAVHMDD